jgi:hypothetical protein
MVCPAMDNGAQGAATTANNNYTGWETGAMQNYNNDIGTFNSNVNSQIAAGNPYESQPYKTEQNITTSGAMNAANNAANAATRDTALRTGTNTAAVAAQSAENARAGQRQTDQFNAATDTSNEDKWLQQQNVLTSDQLAGAQSEAGVYGTSASGSNAAIGDLTSLQGQQDALWQAGIGAVGTAAGGALGAGGIFGQPGSGKA